MTSDDVIRLTESICDFMVSLGGPYIAVTEVMQRSVIDALVTGQYVLKEAGGEIEFFASFWRTDLDGLERLKQLEPPTRKNHGPVLYIIEAASRAGTIGMSRALKDANPDAECAYWHRDKKLKRGKLNGRYV